MLCKLLYIQLLIAKNAIEDPVHVGQVAVQGKGLINLFNRKIRKDFRVLF